LRERGIGEENIFDADVEYYCQTGILRHPVILDAHMRKQLQSVFLDIMEFIHNVCEKHAIPYYLYGGTLLGAVRHKGFIPWDDDVDITMFRKDYDRFFDVVDMENTAGKYMVNRITDKRSLTTKRNNVAMAGTAWCPLHTDKDRSIYIDIMPMDNVPKPDGVFVRFQDALQFNIRTFRGIRGTKGIKKMFGNVMRKRAVTIFLDKLVRLNNNKPADYAYYFCGEEYRKARTFPKQWFAERVLLEFENLEFWAPKEYGKVLTAMYGDYMTLPPESQRATHPRKRIDFGEWRKDS
jgi:lipopolysaccharide cholinephosphotransferase